MAFNKQRLAQMGNIDDIFNERLTPEERAKNDQEALAELTALKTLQRDLSRDVILFMAERELGVPDLNELMHTSSRQGYKIVKAEANLTLASLVELGRVFGKRPRILWDDLEPEAPPPAERQA
jgi:hypothetical protein